MRAVPRLAAIHGVTIGCGGVIPVVGIADQVVAAHHFLRVVGACGHRGGGLRFIVGRLGAQAAKIGVRIVQAGVNHRDRHAPSGRPRAAPRLMRTCAHHGDCVHTLLRHDTGDTHHIRVPGEAPDRLRIAGECHTPLQVMRSVQHLRIRGSR